MDAVSGLMAWVAEQDFIGEVHRMLSDGDDDPYHDTNRPMFKVIDGGFLVIAVILVLSFGSLAAGAGIGGGGLFVPIYAFILGVGAKAAVPLSKATILGAAIGNYSVLHSEKHPRANRPIIDYEVVSFMQCGELLGVVIGVLLNLLLPELMIIILMVVLLSFNAYKTILKGILKYKGETAMTLMDEGEEVEGSDERKKLTLKDLKERGFTCAQLKEAKIKPIELLKAGYTAADLKAAKFIRAQIDEAVEGMSNSIEMTPQGEGASTDVDVVVKNDEADTTKATDDSKEKAETLAEMEALAANQYPAWAYAVVIGMTSFTVLYAILKNEVFSACHPAPYWIWYWTPVPVLGGAMVWVAHHLRHLHERRVFCGYEYLPTDAIWSVENLKKYPSYSLLAGVIAGMLGLGGGMILGPLFIEIGLEPKSASSSCAFMILWTACSGVTQYYFAGKLNLEFLFFFIGLGFISGQIGQRGVSKVLAKTGRPSIVVLLLGSIILVACISMLGVGLYKITDPDYEGDPLAFSTKDFGCGGSGGSH